MVLILCIITIPVFKQETLLCKNWCFCYLYMESLFFIWFFLNEFLRKIPFRNMIVLLYNHYPFFLPKRGATLGNFNFFTFLAHLAERPYEVLPSLGVRCLSSVVCSLFTFESSPLKPLRHMSQSLLGSIHGRSSIKIAHFSLMWY